MDHFAHRSPVRHAAHSASAALLGLAILGSLAGLGCQPSGERAVSPVPAAIGGHPERESDRSPRIVTGSPGWLDFPEIEGWYREGPRELDDDSYTMAYNSSDGVAVTVYVYKRRGVTAGASWDAESVRAEFERSSREILELEKMGAYQHVEKVSETTGPVGSTTGAPHAWHAEFQLEVDGVATTSELRVTVHAGRFVKIRSTRALLAKELTSPTFNELLDQLGAMLAAG